MDGIANGMLEAIVEELRTMYARAETVERGWAYRLENSDADTGEESGDGRLRYEWLLGRLSGISEALAYAEGIVKGSNVEPRQEG